MKRTEKKRKDIIEAAVEEFRQYGFEGARTTRIAKSAEVSSRTLYNHFPTKDALFDEIVEIIIAETGAICSAPFDPLKPVRPQLVQSLEDYIAAITDDRYMGLNRMVMTEYLRDVELARRIFARTEMSNNPVRSIVSEAIAAGLLVDVDPDFATVLLTAGAKAFFFWPKFLIGADNESRSSAVIEDCVDMFLMKYQAKAQSSH
ncbi:MAG: TetR/AcrR family transcriptional regulator [Pseudomonadota bacterium]